MTAPIPLLVSRSAIQARHDCEVLRFLEYDLPLPAAQGPGLVPIESSLPLISGQLVHSMLARCVEAEGRIFEVDRIITEELAKFATEALDGIQNTPTYELLHVIAEQSALAEGLVRGWVKHRLPQVLEEYYPVSIEQEWRFAISALLHQPVRMDLILRRRADNVLGVKDFKTVSWLGENWGTRYQTDLQTILYVAALEQSMGEPIEGISYEGLVKGQRKQLWKQGNFANMRVQSSPLCYGYANRVGQVNTYQTAYTNKANWHRIASWAEMPVKDWVEKHAAEALPELFISTIPLKPSPEVVRRTLASVERGELRYAENVREVLRRVNGGEPVVRAAHEVLEARPSRCLKFGLDHPCALFAVCHDETVGNDPLASGLFKPRVDHHAEED